MPTRDLSTFRGKRVLVTGHTGFKGAWLCLWLEQLGAEVTGFALPPEHATDNLSAILELGRRIRSIHGDLRDREAVARAVADARPQLVMHLAAEALVRRSYRAPLSTWDTNVMGTLHLYEALRASPGLEAILTVTTDKVYRDQGWPSPYRESDTLGGRDPYAASKACVEIVSQSYRECFFAPEGVALATARAGNVIGGGDFSEDRIVPDLFRAVRAGQTLEIRSPGAIRPWQHVVDALAGYLMLASRLGTDPAACDAWNFGPREASFVTVGEIVERLARHFPRLESAVVTAEAHLKETAVLKLDSSRARALLGWEPKAHRLLP